MRPVITERSMKDAAANRYTFAVVKESTKPAITAEVAKIFGVKPIGIKTITVRGKTKMSRKTRQISRATDWKKAIIELPKEQKIDLFDVADQGGKNA